MESDQSNVCFTESPEKREQFAVEEFFDFPIEDVDIANDVAFDGVMNGNLTDSSPVTAIDSCNSSVSQPPPSFQVMDNFAGDFTNELCVPMDDLAELEWISKIEEESLSTEDLENLHLINGMKTRPDETSPQSQPGSEKPDRSFSPEMPVPAKARSKRARTGPGNWTSRLLRISPTSSSSSDSSEIIAKKTIKIGLKKSVPGPGLGPVPGDGRKCLHCATDKTPQWRTGPKGPKTLCNACGVRYKSGRLVPEYRPASSPTFLQTKHSNSHRKVMELRRQKEGGMRPNPNYQVPIFHHQHRQSMPFDASNGEGYLMDFQPGVH